MCTGRAVSCLLVLLCVENDASSPLLVTPYLDKGDVETARSMARVTPDMGNVTSYSGFFSINTACSGHLFFWFFPAKENWQEAPVLLWLQGGPGASSMYGTFELIGPFKAVVGGEGLVPRNYSWTNISNILFIDNPIGAGFSYSDSGCFAKDIPEVGEGLYSAVTQFFKMFPELQGNDFWLTGESFAGHYIPVLGVLIHQRKATSEINFNLKGIVVGNPLTKLDCHDYASFLYNVGIFDDNLRDQMYDAQDRLKQYVQVKNYTAAVTVWNDVILNGLLGNKTNIYNRFNILSEPDEVLGYLDFFNSSSVREQIHVGNTSFYDMNWDVYDALLGTIAEPFADEIQELLRSGKYVTAFYSGQLDIICLYTSTVCILRGLDWSGRQEYLNATRHIWTVDGELAGWFKTAEGRLLDILIKDSGHSVPLYKPAATYAMIKSIISSSPGKNPLWDLNTMI